MKWLFAFIILFVALPVYAQNPEKVVGSWEVISIRTTTNGTEKHPMGDKPVGFIIITPTRVAVMLTENDRKVESAHLSDAEALKMFKSSVAWTGYVLHAIDLMAGVKLTVHVDAANNQGLVGEDCDYVAKVDGNKLMWTSPDMIDPQTGAHSSLEIV